MSQQFPSPGQGPQQVPLDYWISTGRMVPDTVPSVLRDMAWNRGQFLGLAVACLGTAVSLLGAALLVLVLGGSPGVVISFAVVGVALFCVAAGLRARLQGVPKVRPVMASRAPGKFSSGVGLAVFLSAILGVGLFPVVNPLLHEGAGQALGFVAAYALLLLATGCLFAAPAYFSEHAREHFRRRIASDPELRRELEAMSLSWDDPQGNKQFGPL